MTKKFKAIVFDMDGTIVESYLDFSAMKKATNIPKNEGILEAIEKMPQDKREQAHKIIEDHEKEGALKSELMRDFKTFYSYLKEQSIPIGILTRNSKEVADYTLKKHSLNFDLVLSRDCCAPKPSADGLYIAAQSFKVSPAEILYIGDYLYDLETARNAQTSFALILNERNRPFEQEADYAFYKYNELLKQELV